MKGRNFNTITIQEETWMALLLLHGWLLLPRTICLIIKDFAGVWIHFILRSRRATTDIIVHRWLIGRLMSLSATWIYFQSSCLVLTKLQWGKCIVIFPLLLLVDSVTDL